MNAQPTVSKIKFTDYHHPALSNGEYTLTITQKLSDDDHKITSQPIPDPLTKIFYVAGPRFYLGPKDIASVFPPATSLGDHSTAFPHIMINRSTLPWERYTATTDNTTPWLALLVVYEEEEAGLSSQLMKLSDAKAALNITELEPGQ